MLHEEEQVLVVERQLLETVGVFQGLTFEVERYLSRLFVPGGPRFMARSKAEVDPGFKQLIPYVIMAHQDTYLSYVRGKRSGEQRLLDRRSIGIGGHINPVDNELPLFGQDFLAAYRAAVEREVAEEVSVNTEHSDEIVALLNDDSTEVGRVHLGIVHYWKLKTDAVAKKEQVITQFGFMKLPELQSVRDSLETWSQLCLDHLPEIMRRHG